MDTNTTAPELADVPVRDIDVPAIRRDAGDVEAILPGVGEVYADRLAAGYRVALRRWRTGRLVAVSDGNYLAALKRAMPDAVVAATVTPER